MIEGYVIPEMKAFENLYYATIRIYTIDKEGVEGFGTGFFFTINGINQAKETVTIDLLITNKHVIEDAEKAFLVLHLGPVENGIPIGGTYDLQIEDFESKFKLHPDPEIDLCALDFTPYLRELKLEKNYSFYYQTFSEEHLPLDNELRELYPARDVFMVGYPTGLWDETNNLPIIRKGVTASHVFFDFNGKARGAVDIATFPGSSGSPLILFEWGPPLYFVSGNLPFRLLGVLDSAAYHDTKGDLIEQEIPVKKKKVPSIPVMIHLGYYVKAKELRAFATLFFNS
jgi:hypothetical protein